jgi:ATP-dependent DNA ligase
MPAIRDVAAGIRAGVRKPPKNERDPLAVRKATLASLLARAAPGLRFNEHLNEQDGPLVFAHACKLGLEGIVSKPQLSVSI